MDSELRNAVSSMDDASVVNEQMKPKKKFVVFIDTQVDFMINSAALYVTGAQDIVGPLVQFAYNLDPANVEGVLFTFDTHDAETYPGSEEAKQFPIHCVYGTAGHKNVIPFNVIDSEINTFTLHKGVFDMWAEDNIKVTDSIFPESRDRFFAGLRETVDTVVVVGVAADFCVHWAVNGFVERGFNVEIPRALTAGIVRDIDTVVLEEYAGKSVKVI